MLSYFQNNISVQDNVDSEKIGIIRICGWGGLALNVAALDTRIKATVASTMYDMFRVNANGYFDAYNAMVKDNPYEDNKELLIIPDAVHTDLYDGGGKDMIPFDKPEQFLEKNLK